jgi:putative hydrolase of the HAD superfamily
VPKKEITNIKAVSFDGDMTLWDFEKVMRHALACTLDELRRRLPGTNADQLTIERMIEIRNEVAEELRGRTTNLEETRLQAFRRTLQAVDCLDDRLAEELNALYLRHRFEGVELYADVLPTFDALAPHVPLGLVSNGNGYPDRCGLAGRFRFVLFSQDLGVEKPDPAMFLTACREAGCEPRELLHVGDSLTSDVAGANAVGAISVWLNRSGEPNQTSILPDYEVSSLSELPNLLGLGQPGPAHKD